MENSHSFGVTRFRRPRKGAGPQPLQNIVSPSVSGTAKVGQSLAVSPGSWSGTGAISYAYQWTRDGIEVEGAVGTNYLLTNADDLTQIACTVTATDAQGFLAAESNAVSVTQPLPSFSIQPSISPLNATVGAVFSLDYGAATANAAIELVQFTLDGADKSTEISSMNWDSTGEAEGNLLLQVKATNSGGTVVSNLVGAILQASSTAPGQISAGSWSLADAMSGGVLTVNLSALPSDGGSAITAIEYRLDGGAWLDSGLAGAGSFQITGLTNDQTYSVTLRAVNAIGAGAESAAKQGTPTTIASGQEVACFGTTNASGSAGYDSGGAAVDGTYGQFSVSGGVITPNTSPLTAGTYSAGGYPVNVSASAVAVSNQTEFNALGQSDIGKTIVVRKGANITWSQSGAGAFGRRTDMGGTIIRGDGGSARASHETTTRDGDAHFYSIKFHSCAHLVLENLRMVNLSGSGSCIEFLEASGGGVTQRDVSIRECLLKTSNPSAHGAYANGSFPGAHGMLCQANIGIGSVSVQDCVFYGNRRAIELPAIGAEPIELVGNVIDMNYEDFIKINRHNNETPILMAGNYCTRPLALSSDSGNPHGDVLQLQGGGGSDANIVLEATFFFQGDARGADGVQVWYIAGNTGTGVSGQIRGCGNVDKSIRSFNVGRSNGFRTEYCATIPATSVSMPYGSADAGHRYDGGVMTGGSQIANSFFGAFLDSNYNGNISVSNSTKVKTWNATTMTNNLPAYPVAKTDGPFAPADFVDLFQPNSGGSLAGKGPWYMVSMTAGEELSQFDMDATLVPTPVLTGLSVSGTGSSFSASVNTSVDLNPIYWAVVPSGTNVTDPRDIKFRRLGAALDYGFVTVTLNSGSVSFGGSSGSLSAGTSYKLVCYQENGWTRQSSIGSQTFTA